MASASTESFLRELLDWLPPDAAYDSAGAKKRQPDGIVPKVGREVDWSGASLND
jgi:hypothetical protein